MNETVLKEHLKGFFQQWLVLLGETLPGDTPLPLAGDTGLLSIRTLSEIIYHEGIVLEAYKDSEGVWTWGIGVTDKSGHKVLRYKDNPQTLYKVFDVYEWLLRTKYLPEVQKAFKVPLNEAQLTAALSFHWNTGGIGRASWVKSFNRGDVDKAKLQFMDWVRPESLRDRRRKERDLFFDGKWSSTGKSSIFPVNKPSYTPSFRRGQVIDLTKELNAWALLARS